MPLRAPSRSSLVLLLLCVLVFAQHPARLLVQGFVSTTVETLEKADAATSPQIAIAALQAMPALPVPHETPVHIDCVVTVHSTPLSVLRI